jgi:site-specific DNA-methyltransferase (adenine-specific)
MSGIESQSIDLILTDPPYQYLKHKLDVPFDEEAFFAECKRVLKPDSFLVFFGRGIAFYRWNLICDSLGFKWLEEVVWDKIRTSSPFLTLQRVHETISVFQLGNKLLNKVYIDKMEYDELVDVKIIKDDLKRLVSKIKSFKTIEELDDWKKGEFRGKHKEKHCLTISSEFINSKDFFLRFKHLPLVNAILYLI